MKSKNLLWRFLDHPDGPFACFLGIAVLVVVLLVAGVLGGAGGDGSTDLNPRGASTQPSDGLSTVQKVWMVQNMAAGKGPLPLPPTPVMPKPMSPMKPFKIGR